MTSEVDTHKVVGVYNAEGSLSGELRYIFKKLIGRGSCALCDLTHGWSPTMKSSWRDACAQSSVEMVLLHLDELSVSQRAASSEAPVIIHGRDDVWRVLMSAEEIARFSGDAEGILKEIEARLSQYTQTSQRDD